MKENVNNFINHTDPTLPIDLSSVRLQEQYAKLTEEEKLMVAAKCLGMDHIPVDIKTFICDDFFLGGDLLFNQGKSVFPFWFPKFEEIFPTPVTTKFPFISLGGCVGAGKSTVAKILGLYHLHRLDCCSNVYKSLGMAGGVKLAFGFFHSNYDTALRDFANYFKFVFEVSPYFRSQYHNVNKVIRMIPSGPQSSGAVLGSQLIYTVLSELGYWRPQDGVAKASEVRTRYDSRFANKRFSFGGVVADSSAKDADAQAIRAFEASVPENELLRVAEAQWIVRPELYAESEGKTFKFYRGDAIQGPRVVEDNEDYSKSGLDPDRVINVPISAKLKFIVDPVRNLRDLAGISYSGDERYFAGNISHLLNCCRLKNYADEEVVVDFYDKSDTIFDHVSNMIYRIPRGTNLFVHYDIGLRKDKTGIALCYYDGDIQVSGISLPKFKFPLLFVVSRKKGQSTSLDHLYQFIKDLISHGYQVTFSADSFASAGIFQNCERDNVEYKALSVDKTMDAYTMFKNVINTERAELPYVNILLREASEAKLVYNGVNGDHAKIDHPVTSSCTEFDYAGKTGALPGTKDLLDAAVGSLYSCYQKYAEYQEGGFGGGITKTMQAMGHLAKDAKEETQKQIQSWLEDIF